tara:strand:+ start:252 stop:599 length:348 start_codon:yes stop_codon:yes gene_type:complete
MPRVTKAKNAKKKHKKVLSSTKGHYGARSRLFKTAKQSSIKSLQYAFRDRKNRKRSFRSLWISRINASLDSLGVRYSEFINASKKKNIVLNRKILSDLAVNDFETFKKVVKIAID